MRLPYWVRKIDVLKDVPAERITEIREAADGHPGPETPALRYTEQTDRWVLLYEILQLGQITPRHLRWMKFEDVSYIAGMVEPHPDMDPLRRSKLTGNVARAGFELQRRNVEVWASVLGGTIGALAGGAAGALVALAMTQIRKGQR